ncbi:NUMOD4 motif-containing HNH endonuclease [Pectobacterium polaris]|uniref:NUMOD4 motif-containing HNH endonuclease n=1 Tax=Pectobacterium polaris TaxID=2042057 RepID=UPI0023AEE34B|nr:NUMOD4 motif-containing HNH endonuclease [Pectobacterium polaris]MDE8755658.1 NUMOD4 motif-containing HNH endonuclease [Pectobacterium polaris]
MLENEIWKKTVISDDYEVSNYGRFRSLDREVTVSSGYTKKLKGKDIKPFHTHTTGYLQIKIKGKKYSAHRMVALAFCNGHSDGLVVNHKNGVRKDNRAENLEWVSQSQNVRHGYKDLGRDRVGLGKFGEESHSGKAVIATCKVTGNKIRYGSAMDAVRVGFDSSSISRCCNGKSRSHKGFHWRFEGEDHG